MGIIAVIGVVITAFAAWYQYRSYKIAQLAKLESSQVVGISQLTVQSNIPAQIGTFVGREVDMTHVTEKLNGRWPIVMIEGLGGVGKTAMAISVAHSLVTAQNFDVVVWASARDHPLTVEELLDTIILRVFGHARHGLTALPDKEALAVRLLHQHKTLLVIDNIDSIIDDGVRTFLVSVPEPSKVLVTSRNADIPLHADVHHLLGLSEQDGAILLRALCADDDRLRPVAELDDGRLRSLSRLVGGLPLMLQWLVGQARTLPLDALQKSIETAQGEASDIYEFIFLSSFSGLSDTARMTLSAVAVYGSPLTFEAIHRTTGKDYFEVLRGIRHLVELSLLEASPAISIENRLYSLHPVTRYYVRGVMRDHPEMSKEIHNNAAVWLLDEAKRQALDAPDTHDLRDYIVNVLAVADWCVGNNQAERVLEFRNILSRSLWVRGFWRQRLELGKLALRAARQVHDEETLASVLIDDLGWTTFALLGKSDEAQRYITDGKAISHRIGKQYLEAKAIRHCGVIEREQGKFGVAELLFREALELSTHIETEKEREEMASNILDMIGVLQLDQGQLDEAKESFASATQGFEKLEDDVRLSKVWNHVGKTYEMQKNLVSAVDAYSVALKKATGAQRRDERGNALFGLARLAFEKGERTEAKRLSSEARGAFEELGELRSVEKIMSWEQESGI